MCTSLTIFVDYQLIFSSKTIFVVAILFLCLPVNANENSLRYNRAIGGESLDTSNFVLYVYDNGVRYVEVPYEYMKQWLDDQKMWRTWSIILIILCFNFFGVLVTFLIHSFRTSSGPFACCMGHTDENLSDDKMSSSEITDYNQTDNIPTFNTTIDPRHLSSLKSPRRL